MVSGASLRKSGSAYRVEVDGEIVPVTALHRELEGGEPLVGSRSCVLLFAGANGERSGLLVDSVSRFEEFEERRIRRVKFGTFRGKVLVGEKWIGVLDWGPVNGEGGG